MATKNDFDKFADKVRAYGHETFISLVELHYTLIENNAGFVECQKNARRKRLIKQFKEFIKNEKNNKCEEKQGS